MKKRIFAILSAIILNLNLIILSGINAGAVTVSETALDINAKSAILMEASTGSVLYEKSPNEKLAPASVTKIMTLLLVVEAIEDGRVKLEDKVRCSENAAGMGGSQVYLEPNEEMTVNDLLKAVVVASANDGAVMLAEYVAGSEEAFITLMNKKAKLLGMNNTTFMNCTGLEDPAHRTTAYDIALMSKALLSHSMIFNYTNIWMDTLRDGKFGLANTNKLIRTYKGINGLKTGSTDTSLFCVSATAKRDDMQLIAVVLGSPTSKDRFDCAAKLLDMGFANYTICPVSGLPQIGQVKVLKGEKEYISPYISDAKGILVEKGKEKLIKYTVELSPDVLAPVEKDQKLGEVICKIEDEEIMRLPIKSPECVKRAGFGQILRKLLTGICL